MKLYRIEELIDKHNSGDIVITKIKDNENKTLIETKTKKSDKLILRVKFNSEEYNKFIFNEDNTLDISKSEDYIKSEYGLENPTFRLEDISSDILVYEERPYEIIGELKYDLFTIFYNYLGKTERIYDTNFIGNIEYEDLSFNSIERKEVKIEPYPPIYQDNRKYPKDYAYNSKVLKESEIIDGLIHEGLLDDGRIFYDAYLGDIYKTRESNFDGAYKRKSGYDRFLGEGYVTIEDGILEMNIYIPKSSYYEVRCKNGNHFSNGTVNKVFVDNVGYYFRSPTDREFIWNRSILEFYKDSENEFYEEVPLYLEKGKHTFKFEYDKRFSTKNNDIDILILRETEVPKSKNPFYIKTYNDFKIGTRTIIPMSDFYVDNDSLNMGTGNILETVKINGELTSIDEVNRMNNKFTILTGTLRNEITLTESGMYTFNLLFRRKNENEVNNKKEEAIISINGKNYLAKVYEDHNDLCTLSLYKRNPVLGIDDRIKEVYLKKENEIKITVPDENNFLFDSLIINSNTIEKHSNVNPKALLYPNIKDHYFIFKDYVETNNDDELNNIDGEKSRSFRSISEYIDTEDNIEFYIEKPPIYYAINKFDYNTRKLEFDIRYKNPIQNLDISFQIKSHYLPKILMIHDDMQFDRYMIFKPYVFESIKYLSQDYTYDGYISKFNKYDAKLVPLQNFTESEIGETIYDLGENWKNKLLNETENLDIITLCHIYSRINY